MSYYTYYTINFEGDDEKCEAFKKELIEISKDDEGEPNESLITLLRYGGEEARLYDIEDWITSVAPHHPDVLVILSGDGEEPEDIWEERWKGNFAEYQRAIIPPFTNHALFTEYEKTHNNNNN